MSIRVLTPGCAEPEKVGNSFVYYSKKIHVEKGIARIVKNFIGTV